MHRSPQITAAALACAGSTRCAGLVAKKSAVRTRERERERWRQGTARLALHSCFGRTSISPALHRSPFIGHHTRCAGRGAICVQTVAHTQAEVAHASASLTVGRAPRHKRAQCVPFICEYVGLCVVAHTQSCSAAVAAVFVPCPLLGVRHCPVAPWLSKG